MRPVPYLVLTYITVIIGLGCFRGYWEWSYSELRGDPDGRWSRVQQRFPIWTQPEDARIRKSSMGNSGEVDFNADDQNALIVHHHWTFWLAGRLLLIFPPFILLFWLSVGPLRKDSKLRFLVTSRSGLYLGVFFWLIVWMGTSWRPPSIFPYCVVGLACGVVVAEIRRQSDQLANKPRMSNPPPLRS